MRQCPQCKFRDGIYWRPRQFDTTVDIAQLEDVAKMNQKLGEILKQLEPGEALIQKFYAYKVTKSGMVWRKETAFLKSEGWSVNSDGAGTPKSAKYKRRIGNHS